MSNETNLDTLLNNMSADELRHVIHTLRNQKPDLENWFRVMIPGMMTSTNKASARVDTYAFRRQVNRAVGQIDYGNHWQSIWNVVNALEEAQAQARTFLENGDFDTALALMRILGEEVAPDYGELEEECQLADFLTSWSEELTEAILGANLSDHDRQKLNQQLEDWSVALSDYGLDDVIDGPLAACGIAPDAIGFELTDAKLNVMAYRQDEQTYLDACLQMGQHYRYALRLAELDRIDDAVLHVEEHQLEVRQEFVNDYLQLAEFLLESGHPEAAYRVGMSGLSGPGRKSLLGPWVAELAERLERIELAQRAWQIAFDATPSIDAYCNLKRLSGDQWSGIRDRLITRAEAQGDKTVLIEMAIEDGNIDRAIELWDSQRYGGYVLREKVVDAAAAMQPDWAVKQALAEAQSLIHRGSKYYPHAVRWLDRVKQIYSQHDRPDDWHQCLADIRNEHGRKYALMKRLDHIDGLSS